MQHPFLLFCVICIFCGFITGVVNQMINDKNAIIRFLGYFVAIVVAIVVLWLVLYCYFDINLLSIAPL